jgi:peptide/nickel transport system permease protein
MGTDDLGRDIFTRVLLGGRVSLAIGMLATVVAIFLAGSIGCISGYFGGLIDNLLMRFVDAMLTIPSIFLIILISVGFGASPIVVIMAIGLTSWPYIARIIRGVVLSIKEKEFVEGARAVGSGDLRIIMRHVVPNTIGPITVAATLTVAAAILTESALSYLGYGIGPPIPSWGRMLFDAQEFMFMASWYALFPGLMILLTVLCINFVGDGLRDAFDPRSFER